jgi:SAM-dependent methyltransferase/alkylhydroperoxidase family enzyme
MTDETLHQADAAAWTGVDRGWGHAVADFATLSEPSNVREYVAMHQHLRIAPGDRVLDLACGSGLAIELAELRGATAAGIDASDRLIAVARDRSPVADIRIGDMCALPWDDGTFDVVTSFRGIWGTTPDALAEAFRVLRPGGRLGLTVWGHIKASSGAWALAPFRLASTEHVAHQAAMVSLGRPGVGEALLAEHGFESVGRVPIRFVWEFSDPRLYARALASTGPAFEAIEHIGEEAFLRAAMSTASDRLREGLPLRAEIDVVGYVARKPMAHDLTASHFLSTPTPTAEWDALCDEDTEEFGCVMNVTELWGRQPTTMSDFFDVIGRATVGRLTFRERGLIVLAATSTFGDSYCSIAWAHKLRNEIEPAIAAAVVRGDDSGLTPTEQAMTSWVRRVVTDPVSTTSADVAALRSAGVNDDKIFAMTFFAAMRLAFSTVNNSLGAHPDEWLRAMLDPQVRAAITYGR